MAVTHDEHAKCAAEAQQNKAHFIFRVIRVVYQLCPFIGEYRLGFVEADAVLQVARNTLRALRPTLAGVAC